MNVDEAREIVAGATTEDFRTALDMMNRIECTPEADRLATALATLVLHARESGALDLWADIIKRARLKDYSEGRNANHDRAMRSRPKVVALLRALAGQPDGTGEEGTDG